MEANNTENLGPLLYEAALQGDVTLLRDLLLRDPLLLHRSLNTTSPILIVCKLGHMPFMWELIHHFPTLLEELDPIDKSNLLHIATRNGHVEVARSLVALNPSLCFMVDLYGRNPVHIAVVRGRLCVLEELVRTVPAAARERVGLAASGDTIIHLCAKYNQLEALRMVMRMVGDGEMLNAMNGDGNTVLHIAVANKHIEMVRFLLGDRRLKKNAQNTNGITARDILEDNQKDVNNDHCLRMILKIAKASQSIHIKQEKEIDRHFNRLESQRSSLMVVASLIVTMAFQCGINPPGGVWQDDNSPHVAGFSIMAAKYKDLYDVFLIFNTIGLVSSLSSILLLISGLPYFKRIIHLLITVTMWVALTAMFAAYRVSLYTFTPLTNYVQITDVLVNYSALAWDVPLFLILLVHIIRGIVRFLNHLRWLMKKLRSCFTPKRRIA